MSKRAQQLPVRLGVNVDHVATVRQARRGRYPDPVHAAVEAELAGADQITIHLRGDRRHIQERDVRAIREVIGVPLNVEVAATQEMIDIMLDTKPDNVTLVPERPDEITTEGGLNVAADPERFRPKIDLLREVGIHTVLFVDPDLDQIKAAHKLRADAVELCTAEYAAAPDAGHHQRQLERLDDAATMASKLGLSVYAGHDLNLHNLAAVAAIPAVEELNIGHALVGRAIFVSMRQAVIDYRAAIAAAAS